MKNGSILLLGLGILWAISPSVMKIISKKQTEEMAIDYLTKEEKEYLLEVGRRTWNYFKENITEKSNYLPPDNYQEDRKEQIVYRTSPTNIGLGLLAVTASYDMGYENLKDTIDLLSKMLDTILKMQKWNGHLYNWYDIKTLKPLTPKYVSTVDSGNFIGYLYTLKQFLEDIKNKIEKDEAIFSKITTMLDIIDNLITNTDFSHLYCKESRIFSIGFNVED